MWPGVSITRALERADTDHIALAHGLIDVGDALRFVARRYHPALVLRFNSPEYRRCDRRDDG